ncbi:CopG family transcriptional regulator [Leminorella grimontii]|nr:CopG family transcriptional regulator [Leminorella grimontii]
MGIYLTPRLTPQKEAVWMNSTIHFRIDEETKRLAMKAAERQQTSLTDLLRRRAEELAEEERKLQSNAHEVWLENQVQEAFARYDAGQGQFIDDEEMTRKMAKLRALAERGER